MQWAEINQLSIIVGKLKTTLLKITYVYDSVFNKYKIVTCILANIEYCRETGYSIEIRFTIIFIFKLNNYEYFLNREGKISPSMWMVNSRADVDVLLYMAMLVISRYMIMVDYLQWM